MEKERQNEVDAARDREKERMDGLNLAALQRLDPKVVKVLGNAGHVALYTFHAEEQEWERKEVEGSLFVTSRSAAPHQQVVVLNRLNTDNFIEPVTTELEMEVSEPYLLLRNKSQEITGIWFYKKEEQTKICEIIQGILNSLAEKEKRKAKPTGKQSANNSPFLERNQASKAAQNDNVIHQKDNRNPEQNHNLPDNRGQQLRTSAPKKSDRDEAMSNGYAPNGLNLSKEKPVTSAPKLRQSEEGMQQQQQHSIQPQTPTMPLQSPNMFSPQQPYPYPSYPYPGLHPQYHRQQNFPQFPYPHPGLQQQLQQLQPPQTPTQHPHQHPQQPYTPHAQPPPGFSTPPHHHQMMMPNHGGEPSSQPQRHLSPEFFVQQLAKPPISSPAPTTPATSQKPPITKETIRELLTTLVQDEKFVGMVHEAYLQQLQKGNS